MQTRKAWRNRGPEAAEAVLALLETLRQSMGATAVALVDDDRSDPSGDDVPPSFWNALEGQACTALEWEGWYRELRRAERVEGVCTCGAQHRVSGQLIHGRWALLVAADGQAARQEAAAVVSTMKALAAHLPASKEREQELRGTPVRGASEPDAPPSEAEPLVWWVRKDPQ